MHVGGYPGGPHLGYEQQYAYNRTLPLFKCCVLRRAVSCYARVDADAFRWYVTESCVSLAAYLPERTITLGVFKIITEEDGSITDDPALFQVFCPHAPTASSAGADAGGRTLFANTSLTYQQMMGNDTSLLRLRGKTQHVERVHTDGCIIRRKTSRVTFGSEEPVKQPIRYSLA